MAESLLLKPRRSRTALVVTAALGAAIAAGVILTGPWEDAGARAPYALLGGGAFAFGGVLGWLAKRPAERSGSARPGGAGRRPWTYVRRAMST